MRILTPLAAAAVLFTAAPALALQDAPPAAAPAPSAEPAESPEEAALEAKADVFKAHMEAMGQELQAAVAAAGSDTAKASADVDVILERNRPEIDAFADEVAAYLTSMSASTADPDTKAGLAQASINASAAIRNIPAQARVAALHPPAAAPAE